MAIVIVGVGNANYGSIDGDKALLRSNLSRKKAKAEIVQFVPFN